MQFILVEKGSRRQYNLLVCAEDLRRVFAKVPVEFLDDTYTYMLVPAGYLSLNTNFDNQAAINAVIQERTALSIIKQDWRKYITHAGDSDRTHLLYHTNAYFRRNKHIFSLSADDEIKSEYRIFEFGDAAAKRSLVQKWQAQEMARDGNSNAFDRLSNTAFGRSVLRYLATSVTDTIQDEIAEQSRDNFSDEAPSKEWAI